MSQMDEATRTPAAEVAPYGRGSGRVVTPGTAASLAELDPAWTVRLLADAGFLLFRGFDADLAAFSAFVRAHSGRITLDPARSFHGGEVAQKVDAGTAAVGLHLENGNSPFRPDLTWFLCEKAAARGSQTTVCDGYRVWDGMDAAARRRFGQDIVYSRRVEEAKWKAFVFHNLEGRKPLADIGFADMEALAGGDAATTLRLDDDGSVFYAYRTPAAGAPTLFGDRPAWANSVFGPSYNYEKPRITFADGGELPADLVDGMRALTEEVTEDLDWRDGDVALIDNTRVMHGRREILDTDRTIYNAQSYLDPALHPAGAGRP